MLQKGPGSLDDPACQACVADVRKSLITATAAVCVISHFLMGVVANMPLALCPGMGLNAYFACKWVSFLAPLHCVVGWLLASSSAGSATVLSAQQLVEHACLPGYVQTPWWASWAPAR
jgi:hypothetical protein